MSDEKKLENAADPASADLATKDIYDICIIGGGINGAGIARDAAGQGWRVALVEKNDLAAATSSASSKFIHGGLRYLEQYAFGLVRKALVERKKLMKIAPHLIQPLAFILPHNQTMRPKWLIRLGIMLYDLLSWPSSMPYSKSVSFDHDQKEYQFKTDIKNGFKYYDCVVDDARLVVANAQSAKEKGATIITHDGCDYISAEGDNGLWRVRLLSGKQIWAKMIVNASGPWARYFLGENGLVSDHRVPSLRLVKGSHIVVPRLYEGDHANILQRSDGRIVFTWPYHGFTAIGTTDVDVGRDPDRPVMITDDEKVYLLRTIADYFDVELKNEDIVSDWSGVRALADHLNKKASSANRDYRLFQQKVHGLPVLSVFGGKITTYRKCAEDSVALIAKILGKDAKFWTFEEALPGGDIGGEKDLSAFLQTQWKKYPWLPQGLLLRYCKAYGDRMDTLLAEKNSLKEMGEDFGNGLYAAEIDYLIEHEWARNADDILWRRTKLGLLKNKELEQKLDAYLNRSRDGYQK